MICLTRTRSAYSTELEYASKARWLFSDESRIIRWHSDRCVCEDCMTADYAACLFLQSSSFHAHRFDMTGLRGNSPGKLYVTHQESAFGTEEGTRS